MYITWLHEKDEEVKQLQKHITDMEQEQIAIMKEHIDFTKQVQQEIQRLEKQNSFMYKQGLEQGKFDKEMEQEYGKSRIKS